MVTLYDLCTATRVKDTVQPQADGVEVQKSWCVWKKEQINQQYEPRQGPGRETAQDSSPFALSTLSCEQGQLDARKAADTTSFVPRHEEEEGVNRGQEHCRDKTQDKEDQRAPFPLMPWAKIHQESNVMEQRHKLFMAHSVEDKICKRNSVPFIQMVQMI